MNWQEIKGNIENSYTKNIEDSLFDIWLELDLENDMSLWPIARYVTQEDLYKAIRTHLLTESTND